MSSLIFLTLLQGYSVAFGLIMAIGPQNAFVIKQGIAKSHVFIVALLCSVIDTLMIIIGTSSAGKFISGSPYLLQITKYGGAGFLFFYGAKSFYNSFFLTHSIADEHVKNTSTLKATILALLAFSFLNPHMYLDTLVLIGTIGAQVSEDLRIYFTLGAIAASFVWFFSLVYGAGFLAPLFKKSLSWKILDFFVGIIMWSIGVSLLV